jgi:hypothetical protein
MLAEIFFLLLETIRSNAHKDGAHSVVSTSRHIPVQLPFRSVRPRRSHSGEAISGSPPQGLRSDRRDH